MKTWTVSFSSHMHNYEHTCVMICKNKKINVKGSLLGIFKIMSQDEMDQK